jgi:2-polyprenyl-6-hydroxyphenyl methylase/3-demethylubiquinone-9 3-methyltransferase
MSSRLQEDRQVATAPDQDSAAASADPGEIARFEAMAAQWWSLSGPMAALHKMNPVRVKWICEQIALHFPAADGSRRKPARAGCLSGLSVVDVGCGGGILSEALCRLGASVTGLEPARKNLEIARTHAAGHGLEIDYRSDTAEAMAAAGHCYDVVCALEVVEHVVDMEKFVATLGAMVKPGGLLFVSTLNRTLKSFALAIVGAEYVLRWVPQGTHQWEKFVKPDELRDAIGAAGLKVTAQSGIIYNPLARQWRISGDTDVNYILAARRHG